MIYLFRLIFSFPIICLLTHCATNEKILSENNSLPIAPPVEFSTTPLGKNTNSDKVIIKSMTTDSEFSVELPGGPTDYDLEVPLAQVTHKNQIKKNAPGNPVSTDRELLASMPRLEESHGADTASLDALLGVSPENGPTQSPSYTLGIAKATEYYRQRDYEFALIEVNNLLTFFPQSPKLHMMKGTIYLKMQNYNLAEKSWQKSLELMPQNVSLKHALARLQQRPELRK